MSLALLTHCEPARREPGARPIAARVNIGRLLAPLDSAQLADFVAALDPVNAAADWDRPRSAGVLVNMSAGESVESLAAYVRTSQTPVRYAARKTGPVPPGAARR